MHQVNESADSANGAEQGDTERDIRDLADGGIGQSFFEIILEQRAQATPNYGHGCSDGQRRQ